MAVLPLLFSSYLRTSEASRLDLVEVCSHRYSSFSLGFTQPLGGKSAKFDCCVCQHLVLQTWASLGRSSEAISLLLVIPVSGEVAEYNRQGCDETTDGFR